jgi:ATPase subunit of ABC transporter with duplicated ATPase domains
MTLLTTRALTVATPRPLFAGLDLAIQPGQRIGLVAANGAGKSTLLRILAGQNEPTSGDLTRRRGLKTGYVEQDVPETLLPLPMHEAIRRALPAADRAANEWRVDVLLQTFETPEDLTEKPLANLSGGWQRMALIARAWIAEPDLLLLDEPSNHLDLARLERLESWLQHETEGAGLLVASHDRAFLDACTTHTLFLRPERSALYAHPFSAARALLEADDARQEKVFAREMKEADRLRANAGRLKNVGINSGSDLLLKKSKQLNARAEAIEQSARPLVKQRQADLRLASRSQPPTTAPSSAPASCASTRASASSSPAPTAPASPASSTCCAAPWKAKPSPASPSPPAWSPATSTSRCPSSQQGKPHSASSPPASASATSAAPACSPAPASTCRARPAPSPASRRARRPASASSPCAWPNPIST